MRAQSRSIDSQDVPDVDDPPGSQLFVRVGVELVADCLQPLVKIELRGRRRRALKGLAAGQSPSYLCSARRGLVALALGVKVIMVGCVQIASTVKVSADALPFTTVANHRSGTLLPTD
jgi:hypothetical protein